MDVPFIKLLTLECLFVESNKHGAFGGIIVLLSLLCNLNIKQIKYNSYMKLFCILELRYNRLTLVGLCLIHFVVLIGVIGLLAELTTACFCNELLQMEKQY